MNLKVKQGPFSFSFCHTRLLILLTPNRYNWMASVEHSKGIVKGWKKKIYQWFEEESLIDSLEDQVMYGGCSDSDKSWFSPNMTLKLLSLLYCLFQSPMLVTYGFWLAQFCCFVSPLEFTEDYNLLTVHPIVFPFYHWNFWESISVLSQPQIVVTFRSFWWGRNSQLYDWWFSSKIFSIWKES